MKSYQKWILPLCICFLMMSMTFVHADVGNIFSGDDFDFGGSGGVDLGLIFFMIRNPIILLILAIAFILYVICFKGQGANRVHDSGFKSNDGLDEEQVAWAIQQKDQLFETEAFKSYVSEVWITLQKAWQTKKWQHVRPFESDSLFKLHQSQLQEFIDTKKTNYMQQQNIRNVTLAYYYDDGNQEKVVVKLDASLLDFTKDDQSGSIIAGSDTQIMHRSYRLEFVRKSGVKTVLNQGINVTNCPNCGAPTEVTSSGQCEYCDSVITNGDYGWVLNRYASWN